MECLPWKIICTSILKSIFKNLIIRWNILLWGIFAVKNFPQGQFHRGKWWIFKKICHSSKFFLISGEKIPCRFLKPIFIYLKKKNISYYVMVSASTTLWLNIHFWTKWLRVRIPFHSQSFIRSILELLHQTKIQMF